MINPRLKSLVDEWSKDLADGDGIQQLYEFYKYMHKHLYRYFEPEQAGQPKFGDRLYSWLNNVNDDDDKKLLFCLVEWIFFLGRDDQRALFVSAYQEILVPFLAKKVTLPIDADGYTDALKNQIGNTAFSTLTDSMDINSFVHLNNIEDKFDRISIRNLINDLSDEDAQNFLSQKYGNASTLVILEDFAGSGTQAGGTLARVCKLLDGIDVVFIPLVSTPKSTKVFDGIETKYANFFCRSPIELGPHSMITEEAQLLEPSIFEKIRKLIDQHKEQLSYEIDHKGKTYTVSPFGFRESSTLFVQHSNCPNNSLTMIYSDYNDWNPLFPRCDGHK